MSFFIYEFLKEKKKLFYKDKVRNYLATLEYQKDMEKAEGMYFARKISVVLLMALSGSILALFLHISSTHGKYLTDDGSVLRNSYGEGEYKAELVATDDDGNEIGEFSVLINEQHYTDVEVKELFEKLSSEMPVLVLGANDSLDHVKKDLNLIEKVDGYPFQISWHIDNYEFIHFDGKLEYDKIPTEGAPIVLTATYTYLSNSFKQQICAYVEPRDLTASEQMVAGIKKLLSDSESKEPCKKEVVLPFSYDGKSIVWSEKVKDNSLIILVLMLIGGGATYVLKDRELKKKVTERSRQLLLDYPQLLSQLVLYLGAGMTMRNIFERLSVTYLRKRENGAPKKFLYEEIVRSTRELKSGMPEGSVYEHFGIRCGGQQYARLVTLMTQSLRKGNDELFKQLEEESSKAFQERLDSARKIGEEAGTKLLLPMILMLVIVMIIIMIPAYLAF